MAEPIRIRASMSGDKALVKVLMAHEMETGHRKDAAGNTVPAWFIQTITATSNGRTVLSAQWGPAMSKNPYLQFQFSGAKAGDKVQITWIDSRGETRSDGATIT